tara:strand:- start:62 stop:445 length:384 start_codon:yes stop_codon:yes gene_type:complete
MKDLNELIKIVDDLVSNFDPTPILEIQKFPLRWEAEILTQDYDFDLNILELDEDAEDQNYLVSVASAIEIKKYEDGSYEFWDGAYWVESHSWISKLNENEDYPSLSLLNQKFKDLISLKTFLNETYG